MKSTRPPKAFTKSAQAGEIKQLIDYPFDVPRWQERKNYVNTIRQDFRPGSKRKRAAT
jgi:hypothetical protein